MKNVPSTLAVKRSMVLHWLLPLCYWGLVLYSLTSGLAFATDYLAGADTAIAGTFGDNTTFERILYLVEASAAGFSWIKTKSPMVLLGLPVLMIVTHFFFKLVAPTG